VTSPFYPLGKSGQVEVGLPREGTGGSATMKPLLKGTEKNSEKGSSSIEGKEGEKKGNCGSHE